MTLGTHRQQDLMENLWHFPLGSDQTGCFGVASDSFSYWDQGSDELLAKGRRWIKTDV